MHFVLLASDFDDDWSLAASSPGAESRWKIVPERAIVTLERGKDPAHRDDLRPARVASLSAITAGLLLAGCLGAGPLETATEMPTTPRRPDGVVIEPPPAMPVADDRAPASGIVALREPLADKDVEDVVRAYLHAFEREDIDALVQLLAQDAVPLGRAGTKAQLVEVWRTRMKNFEYQRLAGRRGRALRAAREVRLRRARGVRRSDASGRDARPAISTCAFRSRRPASARDQLFGDVLVLLLRREDGRLRIAGQADES